jgi:cation diffusion facilitator family transporter
MFLNFLVSGMKVFYGIATSSASMTADGFHSLSDGSSNIVGLIGLSIASRPKDASHPYGHQKFETLTSMGIGALLIAVAFNVVRMALDKFANPVVPDVTLTSFAVMIITMAVNIWVMIYEYNKGRELKSDFLVSDSHHTRSDILTSSSVIVSLIAVRIGFPILDPIISIFIAGLIGITAVGILSDAAKILTDASVINTTKIEKIVASFSDVRLCHKIRTRGREDSIFIDLHIWVDPDMHIDKAHALSHEIERRIEAEIPGVREVIAHIEPAAQPRGLWSMKK